METVDNYKITPTGIVFKLKNEANISDLRLFYKHIYFIGRDRSNETQVVVYLKSLNSISFGHQIELNFKSEEDASKFCNIYYNRSIHENRNY